MRLWLIRRIRAIFTPALTAAFTTPATAARPGTSTAPVCRMWRYLISRSKIPPIAYAPLRMGGDFTKLQRHRDFQHFESRFRLRWLKAVPGPGTFVFAGKEDDRFEDVAISAANARHALPVESIAR